MADISAKADTAVDRPSSQQPQLCACCKVHPVSTGAHPAIVDVDRIRRLTVHPNRAVAHVAGVAVAIASEVEDWKALAAAATDPTHAETFRKHAAAAVLVVGHLAIVAQDAAAVIEP